MKQTKFVNQYGVECDVVSTDEVYSQFVRELRNHGATIKEDKDITEQWTQEHFTEASTED